ncbi:MAG: radical SAM protein [Elusimicrobiota bacterium]
MNKFPEDIRKQEYFQMGKMYFYTSGCRVNQYETQWLKESICEDKNHTVTQNIQEASLAIINSCAVTQGAEADCRQIIRRIKRVNPFCRILVTGCFAKISPDEIRMVCPEAEIIPDKERLAEKKGITYFDGHRRAFLKIQDGCDAFCSYCVVPHIRNKIYSKPAQEVLSEIESLISNGYREIVFCGIRLGKYINLPELLKIVIEKYEKDGVNFALSSIEIQDIDDELIDVMAFSERIVRHLHIPLQSGDNYILHLMNRHPTRDEFLEKIMRIKRRISGVRLSTDVIVGFPGETRQHFQNTVDLIEKCGFSRMHVFKFSPRQGTKAAALHLLKEFYVDPTEVKRRLQIFKKTLTTS